jgi:hypothetical protein
MQLGDAYRFAWIPSTPEQVAAGSKEDAMVRSSSEERR